MLAELLCLLILIEVYAQVTCARVIPVSEDFSTLHECNR
jgi:hypothetical protein